MEKGVAPLVLAYVGDAVYELYIRKRLVENPHIPVGILHRRATRYVCAEAQFRAYHSIEPLLTEEEVQVFKHGRNAKSATTPRNADITHYRHATGLEALIGFLYMDEQTERLEYIMGKVYDALHEQNG